MALLPLVAEASQVLGAEGVQMDTRVLASREALVHNNFKQAILAANDAGTVLLDIPGNLTMRVLRTGLATRVAGHEPDTKLLGKVTELYFDGDVDASVANTGQVSSCIAELLPVAEIIRQTSVEIEAVLDAARSRAGLGDAFEETGGVGRLCTYGPRRRRLTVPRGSRMERDQRPRANDTHRSGTCEACDARRSQCQARLRLAVADPDPGGAHDQQAGDTRHGDGGERRQ